MTEPKSKALVKIETQSAVIATNATATIITDQLSFARADDLLDTIKGLRNQIAAVFDPIIKKTHEAHKEALAQKKKLDGPLNKAEAVVKAAMATYLDDLDAKRQKEETTAQAMEEAGLGDLAFREHVPAAKMDSSYTQTRWHAEVTDLKELLKSVLAGQTTGDAVSPNMVYLNGLARSRAKEGLVAPGVKAVSDRGISHKAGG